MDFTLSAEQQDLYKRALAAGEEFRDAADQWDADDAVDYPGVCNRMDELGFLGLTMPAQYGGQDGTALSYLIAASGLFRGSRSWIVGEPLFCTSGPGPAILLLGSDALKEKYLPHVVKGTMGCAIALTESKHGSDLTHLETTARQDGDFWIINGEKAFITGAVENELYAVFARFDDIPGAKGVGCVIVEKGMPGFTMDRGPEFVGDRGLPHGNLALEGVRIPGENVVRGPGHFAEVMGAFNMERLHNASISLGFAEAAFDEVCKFTESRESFGRSIVEFQSVYHSIADMFVTIEAHRLLVYRAAATATDGHFPQLLDVSVAKLFGATMLPQVTMKGIELHGGYGATFDYPIQRLHRDAVTNLAAGGTPAMLRNGIASQLFPGRRFSQTRG